MGMNDRKFGVELEFYGPEYVHGVFDTSLDAPSEYDFGHSVIQWQLVKKAGILLNKNHRKGGWKLEDEYLGAMARRPSLELSSAILKGQKGINQLKAVAKVLRDDVDCVTDARCGLHVHVDVSDLTPYQIAAIVTRYSSLEDKIDQFVHPSRRKNKNRFCEPVKGIPAMVWEAINYGSRTKKVAWVEHLDFDRQTKVNINAVAEFGTLEFRHYHGTLDPDKIEAWVKFCLNFVEQTVKSLKGYTYPKKKLPPLNPDVPSWILAERSKAYPQDVSYAFPRWSNVPTKGLTSKYLSILQN